MKIFMKPFRMIRWHIISILLIFLLLFILQKPSTEAWLWLTIFMSVGYTLSMGREASYASMSGKEHGKMIFKRSFFSTFISMTFCLLWLLGMFTNTDWSGLARDIHWLPPLIMFLSDIAEYFTIVFVSSESSTHEQDIRYEKERGVFSSKNSFDLKEFL